MLEEQTVFLIEHVDASAGTFGAIRIDLLAVVAREIGVPVCEPVTPHLAVILASRTNLFGQFKPVRFEYIG